MRLLHLIDTLGTGGAERVLVGLIPELRKKGFKSSVAVLGPPYDLESEVVAAGAEVFHLGISNRWNFFAGAHRLQQVAKRINADLIHANLLFPIIYAAGARSFNRNIRTVATYHNLSYSRGANRPGLGLFVRKRLNSLSAHVGIDRILAVSPAVADHLRQHLSIQHAHVVYNPVDLTGLDAVLSGSTCTWPLVTAPGTLKLLLPGRLVHEKGHADLIDALTLLSGKVSCVFAGTGPEEPRLRRLAAERNVQVHMTGPLSRSSFLRLMQSADLVVTPSRYEGFGLAAAEALYLGTPVIAADVGGLTEIVKHEKTGLLVPPRDSGALALAIERVRENPSLAKQLAERGHEHVRQTFAAEAVAERIAAHYRELLSAK